MSEQLFGSYDIRGTLGRSLDSRFARRLGIAFGDLLSPGKMGRFLVGHDARRSSPGLAQALAVGLREAGHLVVEIGLVSTPLVYWFGAVKGFDGSAVVTASHLGPEHNGFKLCRAGAVPLTSGSGLKELERLVKDEPAWRLPSQDMTESESPLSEYMQHMAGFLRPSRPLKLAVDCGGGAGGPEISWLAKAGMPIEIIGLGLLPDGDFAGRHPNPFEPGALAALSQCVTGEKCDFGVAFDGDMDRAVFLDERGRLVPPDMVTALIATAVLEEAPGATILYDLRSSRSVPEDIARHGGKPLRTRVGHSYIKELMREHAAAFAGELSGHYYFADLYGTDNALRTFFEMINLCSRTGNTLSARVAELSRFATSGEVNLSVDSVDEALARLEQQFASGSIDRLDGLSVDFETWWFNARGSRTEPYLRLNVGAMNDGLLAEKLAEVLAAIGAR